MADIVTNTTDSHTVVDSPVGVSLSQRQLIWRRRTKANFPGCLDHFYVVTIAFVAPLIPIGGLLHAPPENSMAKDGLACVQATTK